jgi:hypothetical protein
MAKKRKKLHGRVDKVITPPHSGLPEKVQIEINEAEHLYREIRVDNELTSERGEKAVLKPGAEVDIIVEADSDATMKKPS